MSTKDKTSFLFIDGLEQLMKEYQEILMDETKGNNHAILFHGETGSGKKMFSEKCISEVKEKKRVKVIDLIEYLQDTDDNSDEKLIKVLGLIENELTELREFSGLSEKSQRPEIFKQTLKKIMKERKDLLLIRLPKIEVFPELYKYYNYLHMDNILLYFVTDREDVVNECRSKNEAKIDYLKCKRVKEGDGIKLIKAFYSKENGPKFQVEDIETLMKARAEGCEMTIGELKAMIENTYKYAKIKNIEIITTATVAEGAVYYEVL